MHLCANWNGWSAVLVTSWAWSVMETPLTFSATSPKATSRSHSTDDGLALIAGPHDPLIRVPVDQRPHECDDVRLPLCMNVLPTAVHDRLRDSFPSFLNDYCFPFAVHPRERHLHGFLELPRKACSSCRASAASGRPPSARKTASIMATCVATAWGG